MEYKRFEDRIVLRLDPGEEICGCVLEVAKKEEISLGSVSGIGATDAFTVGVFNMARRAYDEESFSGNHEITNLCGNLTTMDGASYSHLHITCAGPGGSLVGGHLLRAVISLTAEIVITVISGQADRKRNRELQINQITF